MARGLKPGHMHQAMDELIKTKSDRAIAIVGGSIIEQCLEAAILERFHHNKAIRDRIFNPSGALGSFSSKIDMGFLLGIYAAPAHRDLRTVKDIRNAFAHSLDISSFNNQKITDLCKTFVLGERF